MLDGNGLVIQQSEKMRDGFYWLLCSPFACPIDGY